MKSRIFLWLVIMHCSFFSSGQSLTLPAGIKNNRIDIGDLDVGGRAITVEAIVSILPGDNLGRDIVCKHSNPNDANYTLRATQFLIRTDKGFAIVRNPMNLCTNNTYHVAGTYDGSNIKYFVNGIEVASLPWTGDLQLNDNIAAIGNMWNKGGWMVDEQFHGYIDEVRIWKVARSQQEIAANMRTLSNPVNQAGLLAYYKFEDGFKNAQGNSAWDGKASARQLSLTMNPYFNGILSTCGANEIATVKRAVLTPAPVPKIVPKLAVATVPKPVPKVAAVPKPAPEITAPALRYVPKKIAEVRPTVNTSNAYSRIEIWDSDCMDFDSVSLKLNGKQLGPESIPVQLYKKYGSPEFTYELDLQPGDNILEIYAINEGMNPFNTVGILLMNDKTRRKFYFKLKGKQKAIVHLFR